MKLAFVALLLVAGCAKPGLIECPTKKPNHWITPHCERAIGAGSEDRESGAQQQPAPPVVAPKPPEKPPVEPKHPKKWEKHYG